MKELHERQDRLEFNKLQKRLRRMVGTAIVDYNMIEEGDKVMVWPLRRKNVAYKYFVKVFSRRIVRN